MALVELSSGESFQQRMQGKAAAMSKREREPTGATPENIALIKQTVGERCLVKAAGGVKDLQTLLTLYELGARRFGIGVRTAEAILLAAESATCSKE